MHGYLAMQHPAVLLPLHTLNDDFFITDEKPRCKDHQKSLQPPVKKQNPHHLLG